MSSLLTNEELLNPLLVLRLYSVGAFPMAEEFTDEINWYCPKIRCIIPLDNFNIPRSLKKLMSKNPFDIRFDYDVLQVVENCSKRESTWISKELKKMYEKIYETGYLHSVECYKDNLLVGGLYGIAIKGAFFGESMFSFISNASKVAFVNLINNLNQKKFSLLDVQIQNPHLAMFGAIEISEHQFLGLMRKAYKINPSFLN